MVEDFKPFHIRMIEQELLRRKLENPRYSLRAFARYLGIGSSSLSRIIKNDQEISPSSSRMIIKKLKFSEEDSLLFLASIAEVKRRKSTAEIYDVNLESFLAAAPGLIFVLNRKKQCLYVNEEAAKFYMHTPQEFIGKTLGEMGANSLEADKNSTFVDQVFERKEIIKLEDSVIIKGQARWYERIYVPIYGKENTVQAVSCHIRDISDRKEEEFSVNFLAQAGRILSSSLDYNETLKNIIDLLISDLADGCFIHIKGSEEKVELFSISHKDMEKKSMLEKIFRDYPYDPECPNFYHRVMKEGKSQFNPVVSESLLMRVGRNKEHVEFLSALEAGSYICVPMNTLGKTIGSATLIRSKGRQAFTLKDLELMEELAMRAAWAIHCTMRLRA